MRQKVVNRWLVLLAGFTFNFSTSAINAFSVFVPSLRNIMGASQAELTLAFTIYNVVVAIFGIVQGALGEKMKIKVRTQMYVGTAFFAAGWLVSGFARSLPVLYLGYGVLAGIGAGLLYTFSITNTNKWFPDKKGFTSGLLLSGAAIGPVFTAPFATLVIMKTSVFHAFIILGVIFGTLMSSVAWLVHAPPENYKPAGWEPGAATVVSTGRNYTWKEMMTSSNFYLLYITFIIACTPSLMMMGSAATIGLEQAYMSPVIASIAVSFLAISNFFGRLFFGSLSDKIGRYKTLMLALAICITGVLFMSQQTQPLPFIIAMCFIGASGGAFLVMFPPLTSENFGVKHSGLNYPIMFTAYSLASFLGPQLVSRVKEVTDEYTMAFIFAAALMSLAIVLVFTVMKKNEKKQEA